ncbi:hypothetical protein ES703_78949 [subsurface metagenome]
MYGGAELEEKFELSDFHGNLFYELDDLAKETSII